MRPVEYYPLLVKKKNDQIWLILQNRIPVPVERIFMYKIALVPGTLRKNCNSYLNDLVWDALYFIVV